MRLANKPRASQERQLRSEVDAELSRGQSGGPPPWQGLDIPGRPVPGGVQSPGEPVGSVTEGCVPLPADGSRAVLATDLAAQCLSTALEGF